MMEESTMVTQYLYLEGMPIWVKVPILVLVIPQLEMVVNCRFMMYLTPLPLRLWVEQILGQLLPAFCRRLFRESMHMWENLPGQELVPPPPIQVVSFRYMTCLIPPVLSFWVGQMLEDPLLHPYSLSLSQADMLMWARI